MRSSKSRSRSKQNRPRTLGNIINRVFDSSGPEGKVRGTPQQIIEKYQLLARDAQLSNDRVAAENFLQHAEHYTRLLAEANREMAAEQEARQSTQQSQGGNGNRPAGERDYRGERDGDDQPYVGSTAAFDVIGDDEAGLVELPEFARPPQRRDYGQDRPRNERGSDNRPNDNRQQENRSNENRQSDNRPNDQRSNENRPREDRNSGERNRNDRPRAQPHAERPREDRRPEHPREPREPRAPHFEEQPAAPVAEVVATPVVAAPLVVSIAVAPVAATAVAAAPVEAAAPAKPAPKPRPRKPAVKPVDVASE